MPPYGYARSQVLFDLVGPGPLLKLFPGSRAFLAGCSGSWLVQARGGVPSRVPVSPLLNRQGDIYIRPPWLVGILPTQYTADSYSSKLPGAEAVLTRLSVAVPF